MSDFPQPSFPLYDIQKSYLENAEEGPFFEGPFLKREEPPPNKWIDFLGFKVASPLGVPAGPLLNSRWTTLAARLGFDIVTYKTIRSRAQAAHPLPNMVYVDVERFLKATEEGETLQMASSPSPSRQWLALTNSFGIPSRDPDYLVKDIAYAQSALQEGQLLIVSIVGTPRPGEDFIEDFVKAAELALEGGAKVIEADFSCPNVLSCEGSIHTNPEAVFEISSRIKARIKTTPLIIKVGAITSDKVLKSVMLAAARAKVEAICGINTLSMRVVDEKGAPALGANRLRAGVCGGPIRLAALEFVERACKLNLEEKLDLKIMGTGGVIEPSHFDLFFEKGAHIAMSAIGMMWDPYLALKYHRRKHG